MNKKKYTKEELLRMDAIEVYKLVLNGSYIKIFPKGFWEQPEAHENAIKCIRYMVENILKLTDAELKDKLNIRLFKENKLSGMLYICFNNSPIEAIMETYPNKDFNVWEFKCVPQGYWNKQTGIRAIHWLIESKLRLTDEQLKEQLNKKLFKDNGFDGMLQACFDNSPIKAIMESYPEKKFKPWEFKTQVPRDYWTKKRGIEAVRWLIDDKLKLTDEQLKEQLNTNLFRDNGLLGMLQTCFNYSPIEAIMESYPEKDFKPWEFKTQVSKGYWTIDTAIYATKWIIENKLKLTDEQLKEQLSAKLFIENGLGGMLNHCFNNSPFNAIDRAYPNKFKKEDFKNYR